MKLENFNFANNCKNGYFMSHTFWFKILKNINHSSDTSERKIVEHWLSAVIDDTTVVVNWNCKYSIHIFFKAM